MKTPVGTSVALAACLAAASPAAAQTCGDYLREAPEQCDDGNLLNLDGCDSSCKFEQSMRITDLRLQRTVAIPSPCEGSQFGQAFPSVGLLNDGIAASIGSGSTSIIFRMLGLDDLTGTSDPTVSVGVLSGPVVPKRDDQAYDGTNDRDWWYDIQPSVIDAQRLPLHVLNGSIVNHQVNAGPGRARLTLSLQGGLTTLELTNMTVRMTNQGTSVPAVTIADPPGHLPIEHLDPALSSYATASVNGALPPGGFMCGRIGALSMAQAPIPPPLRGVTCGNRYDATHSLLDAIVGGCVTFITGTQPDTHDPDAPLAGAGPPYEFTIDGTNHVTGCEDSANQVVDLNACLADAAYSSNWRMAAGRVVALQDLLVKDDFDSGDLAAWTTSSTDGGDLVVDPSAQMGLGVPNGLLGTIDDTVPLFVEDQTPNDEPRYRARFFLDPTGFDPGEANGKRRVRLFIAFEDGPRRLMALILRRINGQYSIRARARLDDNTQADSVFTDITAGPHRIEFDWIRSSGPDANDGRLRLWIDEVLVDTLTGLDNSVSTVDFVRWGAISIKDGANGTLKWDHFESRRMGQAHPD